jgi:hypothetical protein
MVAVLVFMATVRLRLLDFPLERDEGEYAYAGQLMLQGIPPYELAYNMKFPGTYAAYAVIMKLFGETPAGIHFGILCMTTLTALMLFWLGKKILDETAGIVAATSYAVLAASPAMLGLAGHATHFAAFFATAGLCVLWLARQNPKWPAALVSGIFFGSAILMKQHAAIIAAWAGVAFTATIFRRREIIFAKRLAAVSALGVGIVLPFGLCCLILWHAGVFGNFRFWTIEYARQYATLIPFSEAGAIFWNSLMWVVSTTVLLWLLATAGLVSAWFDERLRPARLWLFGFGMASALTVLPGFYFRNHYFLLTLPAVALFAGCAASGIVRSQQQKADQTQLQNLLLLVYAVFLSATVFINCDVWISLTPAQAAREVYGSNPFSEAQTVAGFIRSNSVSTATVAVIGSEPEIYFLAHRHSATGFIYTYALMEAQPFALKMQDDMAREIEARAPEFVVCADSVQSLGARFGGKEKILDWWKSYQMNYALVGLTDIISPSNTVNVFGANAVALYGGVLHGTGLEVYRRKPNIIRP